MLYVLYYLLLYTVHATVLPIQINPSNYFTLASFADMEMEVYQLNEISWIDWIHVGSM